LLIADDKMSILFLDKIQNMNQFLPPFLHQPVVSILVVMLQAGCKVVWRRRNEVTQGRDGGMGSLQGAEVLLHDGDNTRSSLHPSVVTLGCLDEGDERGEGQGHYSSWLGLQPEIDPATRIGL
jgi:hypothetical protein